MLRDFFPNTNEGALIYEGFLFDQTLFCKIFPSGNSIEEMLGQVNIFLEKNGYDKILFPEINNEVLVYEKYPISLSPHGYKEEFVLYVNREPQSNPQTKFLINELKKFRNERDWEQFHNPKDLSMALSIEANELLEQFLWKKPEEADKCKLKEELADVFAYALLLADKLEFDVEEIVIQKIKMNGEKYPIEKAKGNNKKHNEL
jgi:NTP pyrophosphatase (non-canonical NTP hydrolase)